MPDFRHLNSWNIIKKKYNTFPRCCKHRLARFFFSFLISICRSFDFYIRCIFFVDNFFPVFLRVHFESSSDGKGNIVSQFHRLPCVFFFVGIISFHRHHIRVLWTAIKCYTCDLIYLSGTFKRFIHPEM